METIKLHSKFVMSAEDMNFLNSLPDNLPNTKLTKKQIDEVSQLYYKYIMPSDHASWGQPLYKLEQKEKWPSGPRVKDHEAKRMVLGWLVGFNQRNPMTRSAAASYFFKALSARDGYGEMVCRAWNVN